MNRTSHNSHKRTIDVVGDSDGPSNLLERNRAWAFSKTLDDPTFFSRLVGQQKPRYFWIGCSDSRVPATEIVDLDPGQMFVHRNVANLANHDDVNFTAALEFAVEVLEVRHIIVVGHYGCGGIAGVMEPEADDTIGRWLAPIRALARQIHPGDCSRTSSANALCELNIVEQVRSLTTHPTIRRAWECGKAITLHGWVYAIGDGLLHPICHPVREARTVLGDTHDWTEMP